MRFIHLTDPHFVPQGELLFELDPRARLAAAVRAINASHADCEFVIITGDLTHRGEHEAYESLAQVLLALERPPILLVGNHDRRAPFRQVFDDADCDENGFVQAMHSFSDATVVTLDTLDEGETDGFMCPQRLEFLAACLADAPADKPLLLFQHHSPFALGLPYMDRISLRNPEAEAALFAHIRKPDYLFFGHVHRPVSGIWHGIPFQTIRGTNHQVDFNLLMEFDVPGTHEAPDYGWVSVEQHQVTVHQCSFLYDGPGFIA